MAETSFRLPRGEWFFDEAVRLGSPGSFGEVFEGRDPRRNEVVAVKRLHLRASAAAHRELTIAADLAKRTLRDVLPVYDSGQDPDTGAYFIVMARAERSLADDLKARAKAFDEQEAIDVLRHITSGLIEVADIVHRDLKPGNVLLHEGSWKLADFGIARFVADATAVNTLKDCLTPAFAAPEQWQSAHATNATDVYALGCIAHVLLTGRPPFAGPTEADYCRQHLREVPQQLDKVDARLRFIVTAALRKAPDGRPKLHRMAAALKEIADSPTLSSPNLAALDAINALEAERAAKVAAAIAAAHQAEAERQALIRTGVEALKDISHEVAKILRARLSEAKVQHSGSGRLEVQVGSATLFVGATEAVPPQGVWACGWEVVAISMVRTHQDRPSWGVGATLWFMRLRPTDEYRWYEVSYTHSLPSKGSSDGPFPIQDLGHDVYGHADKAAGPGMHVVRIEAGPTPIDDEALPNFSDRWLARLVAAYHGKLRPF